MIELLHSLPIFSPLKKKELKFLAEIARVVEYPPNTTLLREGDRGNCLYVIVEGRLEILKSLGTAEEYVLGLRGRGEQHRGDVPFQPPKTEDCKRKVPEPGPVAGNIDGRLSISFEPPA